MMIDETIRIVVADDHAMFREGIVALLSRASGIAVIAQAHDSLSAVTLTESTRPDVLLLDVSMPGELPRTTIVRLRRSCPNTRVIILTMHQDLILQNDLLAAGASAYLTKTAPSQELILAIRNGPSARSLAPGQPSDRVQMILTAREREVLRLVAQARSNHAIAETLRITEGTVKRHLNNIFEKLNAASRIDATRKALRLGILKPPYA